MEEKLNNLYELCEIVSDELKEAVEKIHQAGSKLSAGDIDYIDKLTHTMKSLKATIAMMESEEGGYSQAGTMQYPMPRSMRGRSYEGNSYRNSYDGYEGGSSYRRSMRRDGYDR